MKKIKNIFAFLLYISHQCMYAQVNNDCVKIAETNRLVCGVATFSDNSNGTGANDFANGANGKGCLQDGEKQSAWYAFKIETAGTLTFTINPVDLLNDYDFAVWGPFSNDIATSCTSLGSPIRCNFSGLKGRTGLSLTANNNSESSNGNIFSKYMDVQAGQVYILMVDNFSQSNSGFSLIWNNVTANSVSGGGGTSTLAVSTSSFSQPTIACNKVSFSNQSATCDGTLTYQWDFGDGSPIVTDRNPTYFYPAPGTYTVTLTSTIVSTTANNGKTETFTRSITILKTPPTASIIGLPDKVCRNTLPIPLQAVGTPTGGEVAFTIFPNGNQAGQIANATTFNPATLGAGTHRVQLTYTSPTDANCVFQTSKNVIVQPATPLILSNINDKYCIDAAATTITATPTGGQFQITNANGIIFNTNIFNPASLGIGTHIVSYTFIDVNTCENIITKNVKVNPLPILTNQLKSSYCVAILPFTIVATPVSSVFTINGNPITQFNPISLGVGNFTVVQTATDENGCVNTKTQMVEITPQTIYSEETFDLKICPTNGIGEQIEILSLAEEQAILAQGRQLVYQWSNGSTGRTYQVRSLNDNGTLIGLAIDQSDCPTRKITFNLDINCTPELYVPTAFSPNGDNLNDLLEIFGKEFINLEFKIFNRWGEIIFVAYNEKESWNGKRYGLNAPDGIYAWIAVYENILYKGKKITQKGFTTLMR